MTFSQSMDDFSQSAHKAVETVCHTAGQLVHDGLENNPLHQEVALLKHGAEVLGTMDPNSLRIDPIAIDQKLQECGVLPHLHFGLDEKNNPTLTIERPNTEPGCFGYMHVPGFGDGPVLNPGRQDQSPGLGRSADCDNVIRDVVGTVAAAAEAAERAADGAGERTHCFPGVDPKVHTEDGEGIIKDAKQLANTVFKSVSEMAKNGWLLENMRK